MQHVREVVRVGPVPRPGLGAGLVDELHARAAGGQPVVQRGVRDDPVRAGGLDQLAEARPGVVGVERQVGGTRRERRDEGDEQVRSAFEAHADEAGPAVRGEARAELRGAVDELGVAERAVAVLDRDGVRGARGLLGDQRVQGTLRQLAARAGERGEPLVLGRGHERQLRERHGRGATQERHAPAPVVGHHSDGVRVEERGGVIQGHRHRAGPGVADAQDEVALDRGRGNRYLDEVRQPVARSCRGDLLVDEQDVGQRAAGQVALW